MNEHAAENTGLVSELALTLARLAVVVIAGAYVVGLLIVNINLAQYGLVRLNLGRPEYIMAGVLWGFFVIMPPLCVFTVARMPGLARAFGQPWSQRRRFIALGFGIIVSWYLFISIYQRGFEALEPLGRLSYAGLLPSVLLGFIFVYPVLLRVQDIFALPTAEHLSDRLWQMITLISPLTLLYFTLGFLATLTLYATVAFPQLPRHFGGGRPPAVELVLTEMPDLPWSDLGVLADSERKHVGPVLLLLETDEDMIFKRTQGSQIPITYPEAFGIKKRIIQAIVYKPRL